MNMSDNFFSDNAQKFEKVIHSLATTNPELFQSPVPGSIEAEQIEKIKKRIDDLSNLSLAELSAYYQEYGNLDIDLFSVD